MALLLTGGACSSPTSQRGADAGPVATDSSRFSDLSDARRIDSPAIDTRSNEQASAPDNNAMDADDVGTVEVIDLLDALPGLTDIADTMVDLPAAPDLLDSVFQELTEPDLTDISPEETALPDMVELVELNDIAADGFLPPEVFDTAMETLDVSGEEIPEPPCEVAPIPACPIHFFIEPTYPVVQDFVWLTGSFNGWAASPAEGALPLTLNSAGTLWQADLYLQDGQAVEYKFLMGWPDNLEPSFVTQDWDFAGGAPNSQVVATCGETGCDIPVFIHRPRLQWPDDEGFWVLAETDINVSLEYTISWDGGGSVVTSAPEPPQIFWLGGPGQSPPGYQHRTFIPLLPEVATAEIQITKGPEWQQTLTRPHLAPNLRLAVYGDTRSQQEPHQMVVDAVVEQQPDAVLVTGDMIDIGVHWWEWEEWSKIEEEILESAFWLPVYGNHDAIEGGKGRPYLETWFQTDNRYRSGGSYWLNLGLVGLVVLDTYSTDFTTDEALGWLEDTLASLQAKPWLFVSFHEPYYSYMGHPPWSPGLETIDPLFHAYGVDIVFNGHDHAYEHFLVDGIHYMVAGGGGAPLSDYIGPVPPDLAPFHIMSGAFYHYVLLDITKTSLTAKVVQLPEDVVVDELILVK